MISSTSNVFRYGFGRSWELKATPFPTARDHFYFYLRPLVLKQYVEKLFNDVPFRDSGILLSHVLYKERPDSLRFEVYVFDPYLESWLRKHPFSFNKRFFVRYSKRYSEKLPFNFRNFVRNKFTRKKIRKFTFGVPKLRNFFTTRRFKSLSSVFYTISARSLMRLFSNIHNYDVSRIYKYRRTLYRRYAKLRRKRMYGVQKRVFRKLVRRVRTSYYRLQYRYFKLKDKYKNRPAVPLRFLSKSVLINLRRFRRLRKKFFSWKYIRDKKLYPASFAIAKKLVRRTRRRIKPKKFRASRYFFSRSQYRYANSFFFYRMFHFYSRFYSKIFSSLLSFPVTIVFAFLPRGYLTAAAYTNFITNRLYYGYLLNDVVKPLIKSSRLYHRGMTILCSGRFNRAQMARSRRLKTGAVSFSSDYVCLDFHQREITLRYGRCNLKIWLRN